MRLKLDKSSNSINKYSIRWQHERTYMPKFSDKPKSRQGIKKGYLKDTPMLHCYVPNQIHTNPSHAKWAILQNTTNPNSRIRH